MYAHPSLTILDELGEVTAIYMIPGKHSTADHISSSNYDCIHFLDRMKYVEYMCCILFPFIEHIFVWVRFFFFKTQTQEICCLKKIISPLNKFCPLTFWSHWASVFENKKNAAYVV